MNVSRPPRIYYCGMVNTVSYSRYIGAPLHVGAASNKMISVVSAIRDNGAKAWLITMPVIGQKPCKHLQPAVIIRNSDVPAYFLPTATNRWMRKALASIAFSWFCLRRVNHGDRVMLYNYALEYLSGLIVLRLRGIRPFLDIEDAPRCDEPGPQALLARLLFLPFFHLSDRRKLTASQHVATRLAIPDACTVYGVKRYTQKDLVTSGIDAWRQVKEGAPLRIHFGGTLSVDSGLLLFCDAVRVLLASMETGEGRIAFLVTGNGGEQELTALQECCKGSPVTIEWRSNLDRETFITEFQKCHAALSLNLPGTSLEETTFPSKVVEITGNGLLLISTRASDIPLIFDDSNAILLDAPSASHLAERIRSMLADPEGMRLLAIRGCQRASEVFDATSVGRKMIEFLEVQRRSHVI